MPDLKLAKLPDRTPVKISISVSPDLHSALTDYADAYHATYGSAESIAGLIPHMLAAFIESDGAFKKARRDHNLPSTGPGHERPKSTCSGVSVASPASSSDHEDSN